MRRTTLIILLLCSLATCAQLKTAVSDPTTQSIGKQGWQVQSYQLSFDKQTIVFAGKKATDTQYDLFVGEARGTQWTNIHPLSEQVNTAQDEVWPTISSDEQSLYFVRIKPASGKIPAEYYIMHSARTSDGWSVPENIIISNGEDISPIFLPDNQTFFFASRRTEGAHNNHTFALFFCRRINDHDWTNPELVLASEDKQTHLYGPEYIPENQTLRYTKQVIQRKDTTYTLESIPLNAKYIPLPTITLKGMVRSKETGRGLNAELHVFNAITSAPIAVLHTSAAGQFRICLPIGYKYNLDITTQGYSHYYETFDCIRLEKDIELERTIQLARQLSVRLHIYDSELSTPLRPDIIRTNAKIKYTDTYADLTLPIGENHTIITQKRGYTDDTLMIDTRKPVLLTESELDIELMPGKTSFSINLADQDSLTGIMGQIEIVNVRTGERVIANTTMRGAHNFQVRQGDSYDVHVFAPGYVYKDTTFTFPLSDAPVAQNIPLVQLREQMVMQLKNIQFELNSAALTAESYDELDKVVRLLKDNPEMKIELSAHTDDQGSDAYNNNLSSRRGAAAKRYLTEQGIAAERIQAVGYGKRKPLVENDSEEHRAMNRRVEFTVLGL